MTTDTPAVASWSARTRQTYTADWALFTDWCAATDTTPLSAGPATVLRFLAECPAAPATHRRRVTGIDHHHRASGYPCPGDDDRVRTAVGRATRDREFAPRNVDAVHAALRMLPSSGWTAGVFGRRDRCLLVLAELGGVPYRHIARLTARDVTVDDGATVITAGGTTYRLEPDESAVLCAACAITRWVEVLDVAVRQLASAAIAEHLRAADRVASDSPHSCLQVPDIDRRTLAQPLLAPIDQWGSFPFPLRALSPHAVSRQSRDLVAGDLIVHRDRPVPGTDDTPGGPPLTPATGPPPRPYTPADWAAAVQRRRADLVELATMADDLDQVDRRAAELNQRIMQLLEHASAPRPVVGPGQP